MSSRGPEDEPWFIGWGHTIGHDIDHLWVSIRHHGRGRVKTECGTVMRSSRKYVHDEEEGGRRCELCERSLTAAQLEVER